MARVGIDIVGTKSGLHHFRGRVSLHHGPLARTEHADAGGTALVQRRFPFLGHDIEGGIPGDRLEIAVFIVLAVFHTQ